VDEDALADALARGVIAGAGLDVLGREPPAADNVLTRAPNCTITPHIAWASAAARRRLIAVAARNVREFLSSVFD
jgi:glycerate dehydrogenase